MKAKAYVFYFHYNKPASLSAGKPKLSVHYRGLCNIVDKVICAVPCESRINKRQPRVVMAGWAQRLRICRGVAVLDNLPSK